MKNLKIDFKRTLSSIKSITRNQLNILNNINILLFNIFKSRQSREMNSIK